jgi:uncharacterized protein (DUF4415 family)
LFKATIFALSQHERPIARKGNNMKKQYDFSKGRRGAVVKPKGKTRITIYIDDDVLEEFRERADEAGAGYQTMMNAVLRQHLGKSTHPLDEKTLRRVIREELGVTR